MALRPCQRRMRACGLLPRYITNRSQASRPEKNASGGIPDELRTLDHRCSDLPKIRYYGSWCSWLRVHLLLHILLDSIWTKFHNLSCCSRGLSCPGTSYCTWTVCCSRKVRLPIHPRHLSLFEKVVLRRGRNYDPELNREAKIQELRSLYNRVSSEKGTESGEETSESICEKVSTYFDWEKTKEVGTI